MGKGEAKKRAAAQPQAWPVTGIAGDGEELLENLQQMARADRIAPGQRSSGIAETEHHRRVDVLWRRDALLRNLAGDIDDGREHPLRHRAG